MEATSKKAIYTIVEKSGAKPFWLRLGWAHLNQDGSFNLHLDALPLNGKLQMRDWQPRDDFARGLTREDGPSDERPIASA